MNVPFADLTAQQAEILDEITPELGRAMAEATFIGGPAVAAFEQEYAHFVGTAHCVGVGNGTDALELALRAVGVEAGAEVILPVNTFIATAEAVSRLGAVPVFVDVDPVHLLIDPTAVAAAVTGRTAAIIPVHLFGQVAPMAALGELSGVTGIPLVEDSAQAQGASCAQGMAGALGAVASTSFYPGKNLGAAGDAGAVTTNSSALARTVRVLSAHGSERKYVHERVGFNSRLDAIQAIVLRAKLRRLTVWNSQREKAADRYADLLAGIPGVRLPITAHGNTDVWHLYVVRVARRERAMNSLAAAGISTAIHYPTPLHLTDAYASLGVRAGAFPIAEEAAGQILSLPMFPHLRSEQQERVAVALAEAVL
jgi:dTDP-4-amino-4,6-dideoxygalactose transaminase